MNCFKCNKPIEDLPSYKLTYLDVEMDFCGRLCLTEWAAPELKNVCAPKQWIPTPEEEARMSQ